MSRRRGNTAVEDPPEASAPAAAARPGAAPAPAATPGFPGARTVALVVAAVGADAGAKLLSHFSAPEVEAIVREVKDMPRVPLSEVVKVTTRLRDEALAARDSVTGSKQDKGIARQQLTGRLTGPIVDAEGMSVLTAWSAGKFSGDRKSTRLNSSH